MEILKQRRQTIKASITRVHNFCLSPNASLTEIKVRMDKVEDLFKQYEEAQQEIDSLTRASTDKDAEEAYRIEMEDKYYALKSHFTSRLREEPAESRFVGQSSSSTLSNDGLNAAVQVLLEHQGTMSAIIERMSSNTSIGNNSVPVDPVQCLPPLQQSPHQHELRLPTIQIPDFDGTYLNWIRFRDLFEAMVHSRSTIANVEKLEYLQTKLKGEALSIIKHLTPTNDNYILAWQLIKKKFDNSDKIKKAYFELLFDQPAIKSSSVSELKRFYNNTNESINALKVLGEPVDQWDSMLLFHLEKKLDSETHVLWYRGRKVENQATFLQFFTFLEERVFELENTQKSSVQSIQSLKSSVQQNEFHKKTRAFPSVIHSCPICNKNHYLYHCNNFKALDVNSRFKIVQANNICINCLRENHRLTECKYSSCKLCNERHNSLLHLASLPLGKETQRQLEAAPVIQSNSLSVNSTYRMQRTYTLLPTAMVMVSDGINAMQPCRALLDSGAQSTLITEGCVQRLNLKRFFDKTLLYGVGSNSGSYTKGKVSLNISSQVTKATVPTEAFCLSNLTQDIPGYEIHNSKLEFFKNLQLADPQYSMPGRIDIILGSDIFTSCILQEKVVHPTGSPSAVNTIFGWIIIGKVADQATSPILAAHICVDLDKQLQRFWETEELPITKHQTLEEEEAERHYSQNIQRQEDGRYVIKLPFKNTQVHFGDSKTAALRRLHAMERRFSNNQQLHQEYKKFMHEFLDLGHMEVASVADASKTFYLSHHAVLKPSSTTTKLRVVFDASCKSSNGFSLNDQMLIGPTIQNDLFTLLIKFRKYKNGFTADVEKMYRQILIHPDDRSYQRILWRDSQDEPVIEYNLKTVTYGTSSAPFLATRTLHQAALDNIASYPESAREIMQHFYVDDFMSCSADLATANRIREDVCSILTSSGFHLRK